MHDEVFNSNFGFIIAVGHPKVKHFAEVRVFNTISYHILDVLDEVLGLSIDF